MGLSLLRDAPAQVRYGPWHIPVTIDPEMSGVLAVGIFLALVVLLLLPLRRWNPRDLIRTTMALAAIGLGTLIIGALCTYEG